MKNYQHAPMKKETSKQIADKQSPEKIISVTKNKNNLEYPRLDIILIKNQERPLH